MRFLFLFAFIILLNINFTLAQEKQYIQLSGFVFNLESAPLSYVHVISINSRRGTITDRNGLFSLITEPGDTLLFSSIGYKRAYYPVPRQLSEFHYTVDIRMDRDTILMEEVMVFPWATYEEFKEAFITLELPEDDYERAIKNLAMIQIQISRDETPSPGVSYKQVMDRQNLQTYTYGQYPINNLLNPIAWAKFIDALKRGKLKIKRPVKEDRDNR